MTSTDDSGSLAFQTSYAGSIPVTRSHEIPSLTSADNPEYKEPEAATVAQSAAYLPDSPLADAHIALVEAQDCEPDWHAQGGSQRWDRWHETVYHPAWLALLAARAEARGER